MHIQSHQCLLWVPVHLALGHHQRCMIHWTGRALALGRLVGGKEWTGRTLCRLVEEKGTRVVVVEAGQDRWARAAPVGLVTSVSLILLTPLTLIMILTGISIAVEPAAPVYTGVVDLS